MSASERRNFFAWYEGKKAEVFDNKRVLGLYCQYEVSVLRESCEVLRRVSIEIGNIDVFLKSITIASASNKCYVNGFSNPTQSV